jgi:hypothetical protein
VKIAIEYERTRKARLRVERKVNTFTNEVARVDKYFDVVLWLCEPHVLELVGSVIGNRTAQHKVRTWDMFREELIAKTGIET